MNNDKLSQLTQLIDQLISQNNTLKQEVSELKVQQQKLQDENETLQLEALEIEEQQLHAASTLESLLGKLQQAQ